MKFQILICLLFVRENFAQFPWSLSSRQTSRQSSQPIRPPANLGSNALAAGNPALPSFNLPPSQSAQLPDIHPDILEDSQLSTPLLAIKRGYDVEVHRVVTSDGYILEMHRIAGSPLRPPRKGKKVVFLQHGFLDSSATWVMQGKKHGFAYLLADQDYDVWMGNARGNVYSRKHILYDPDGSLTDRQRFWSFSWHEIGIVDLPTMIDYTLNKTQQSQLFYVGHSQGTTAFFVMCSERPEYNTKVKMMHALAPVAFMDHAVSPIVRLAELMPSVLQRATSMLGAYEILPSLDFFKAIGQQICRDTSPFIVLCESVLFLITGFNERNLNATLFPVYLSHTPAGAATYQLVHYVQLGRSGRFNQYDWGTPEMNFVKYGSEIPPDYNLKNVVARVILHYADNDWLAAVTDVERLHKLLPNSEMNHVSDRWFEHMDFVWGIETKEMLYEPIIVSMKLYDSLYSK